MAGDKVQLLEEKNIHLWFGGSPIVLCTMKLELNKKVGAILAYAKMLNVQPEHIREVVFDLICYDSVRLIVDTIENCKFTGLDIPRNGVFGMDVPIRVKNPTTRNIEFVIKSVTTTGGETWQNENGIRFNMSLEQKSLINVQGDLNRQFLDNCTRDGIDYTRLIFQPVFNASYWLCACGALNWSDEPVCCECKVQKKWLYDNIQSDLLKSQDEQRKNAATRVRREVEERERQEKEHNRETYEKRKAEYENQLKKQKSRKNEKKFILVLIVLFIFAGGGFLFFTYGLPYIDYQDAVMSMNRGEYDTAAEKFDKMKGYRDSDELKIECMYKKAIDKFYARDYSAASQLFSEIGSYKDSTQRYTDSLLGMADGYLEQEDYVQAYSVYVQSGFDYSTNDNAKKCAEEIYKDACEDLENNHLRIAYEKFAGIGDFKKSTEYATECQYRLANRAYDRGEYKSAIDTYTSIAEYKDVGKKLKKLEILSIILSASPDVDTPAAWDVYDGYCPECGNKAQYVLEFYQNGKYKFKVVCDNNCEIEDMTGKFKIEDKTFYLSNYIRGILIWEEAASIKSVKQDEQSVEGKNTAIVMTDPLNQKNKKTVTLYGNNVSDNTISIA